MFSSQVHSVTRELTNINILLIHFTNLTRTLMSSAHITTSLQHVLNCCLIEGVFVDSFKTSKITKKRKNDL